MGVHSGSWGLDGIEAGTIENQMISMICIAATL
jgi:hypothetical protein